MGRAKKEGMSRKRRAEWKQAVSEWAEFLREDYDWDYDFILRTLKYKLGRTRKKILENDIVVSAKQIAMEILEVEKLIGRVMDHDYHEEHFKAYHKKYGRPKMVRIPPTPEEKEKNPEFGCRVEFLYRGKPATAAMNKESMALFHKAEEARVADLRKAFSLMAERIFGWWD
jgi:hypothetical protein